MNTMRMFLATLCLAVACPAAQWSVGCRLGLNLATVSGDLEDEFLTMNPGLHVAADAELGLGKWLGLRSGVAYTMKGVRWNYDRENAEGEESSAHDDTKAHYLEIPLSLQFRPPVSWKIKPHVSFGPALGFFLGAKKTVEVDGEEVYSATRNKGARNVDLGLTAGGARLVICYMSIGEAEDYRYYWRSEWYTAPPSWMAGENPAWPGNYKVRYWDPAWQALILGSPDSYLDRILAAGFDGVYLDIIDAFEYFENSGKWWYPY